MEKRFTVDGAQPVTIRQVAQRAGVSPTLVSFVLNGTRRVSPEKAKRVLDAVEELGYSPNANARSLRSRRTGLVGVVVPHLSNPFFALLAGSAEQALGEQGYLAIICSTGSDPTRRRSYFDALLGVRVEGLLVYPTRETVEHVLTSARRGVPVILIEREVELPATAPTFDAVVIDNEQGARRATDHLIELGHRRIGLVTLPAESPSGPARISGYRKAFASWDLPVDESLIAAGTGTAEAGRDLTAGLLCRSDRPTALVITTNMQMLGALEAVRSAGLSVPDDLSIVGFGPSLMPAASLEATLVKYPAEEVGRIAAERLVWRLRGEGTSIRQRIVLQPELHLGHSTRQLASTSSCVPRLARGGSAEPNGGHHPGR